MKLTKLRDNSFFKSLAVFVAVNILAQLAFPTVAFALTSGPSQPEVQSFEPVGTTEMVDLFTGDFTYNIPLFELPGPNGGYPFNLAYHSGIGMDQEASWVGLGWNLNPGTINRSMRGLPDDFNGDIIKKTVDMKKNVTYGLGLGANFEPLGADLQVSLGAQLKIYYNNYRGVGYSLEPSIGFGKKDGAFELGLGLSLDSQEGVGANASLSLSKNGSNPDGKARTSFTGGIGFNSKRGLDLSLTASGSNSFKDGKANDRQNKQMVDGVRSQSSGGGSSFSFSERAYTPMVSLPMRNKFVDVRFKTGAGFSGAFASVSMSGFYSTEYLSNARQEVQHAAYGYNYIENALSGDLMDFNRYNDGTIRKESPNLAMPNLTYDYYNVTGQGTGGMYRPYRSDVGVLHDPYVESNTFGGAVGLDIGPPSHVGVSATISWGNSYSGVWDNSEGNQLASYYAFKGFYEADNVTKVDNDVYEPVYYKMHGEMTSFQTDEMDYIGGEDAVRADLMANGQTKPTHDYLKNKYGVAVSPGGKLRNKRYASQVMGNTKERGRMPRNTSVQPLTNTQMGGNGSPVKEYNIKYYPAVQTGATPYTSNPATDLLRSSRSINHIGAVTSLNQDGMRYVYGLPAYNNTDETYNFSTGDWLGTNCAATLSTNLITNNGIDPNYNHDGTNEFLDKTELPAYAYSYLLTSVLGTDYVDSDPIAGPSDGDMGYWVKFNYVKTNNYNWRAPFTGANYSKGFNNSKKDNTVSFKYGEKEVYHLASVETKTHVAVYHLSTRSDARGAYEKFNGRGANPKMGAYSYQLDKISLYAKNEYQTNPATAIPIKEVHFTYDNSLCQGTENSTSGKLTLKSVHFTYQKNNRGALTPYEFVYNTPNHGYSQSNYDRWGNYKSGTSTCDNLELPYVDQFDESNSISAQAFHDLRASEASAWHLSQIKLPTGGSINVEYESDDYGYVQHKQAQQMFQIDHLSSGGGQIYSGANYDSDRRIYFKLEDPSLPIENYIQDLLVDGKYQVYYKIRVNLRDDLWEYISGYANIEGAGYGIESGFGYIDIEKMNINGTVNYHPFAVAAWQHMRTNEPDLLVTVGEATGSELSAVKSLATVFPELLKVFKGYRKYCADEGYATNLDPAHSFIRLCSPDKKKFGGGQRVKRISINDEWNATTNANEASSSYGQEYDYTMQENGQTISSGVAQYEPMIGGDENALRYAKNYPQSIPTMTDNNLFFEYPINESYFPAPVVGYRKITVRSIATKDVMDGALASTTPTTGITESEFYTAKDYPVFTDETDLQKKPYKLYIPIPLIGQIEVKNLTASQGYSIALNDMHGKPKSVKSYAIDKDGKKVAAPISSVAYTYKDKVKSYQGKTVRELDNEVEVILDEIGGPITSGKHSAKTEPRIMGVEYEFFTDMRRNHSESNQGGVQINNDWLGACPFCIPGFFPWPTVNTSTNNLSTVVTNKIIHKAGILQKTVATDGQSTVETNNLLHDAQTGRVLLASVTNNFDAPVYKYDIPAHWKYSGMDAAYKNWGVKFITSLSSNITNIYDVSIPSSLVASVEPGDEFIVTYDIGGGNLVKSLATYLGQTKCALNYSFYSEDIIPAGSAEFLLYRSGKRNQLTTDVSNVVTLGDKDPLSDLGNPTKNIEYLSQYLLNGDYTCGSAVVFDHWELTQNSINRINWLNCVFNLFHSQLVNGLSDLTLDYRYNLLGEPSVTLCGNNGPFIFEGAAIGGNPGASLAHGLDGYRCWINFNKNGVPIPGTYITEISNYQVQDQIISGLHTPVYTAWLKTTYDNVGFDVVIEGVTGGNGCILESNLVNGVNTILLPKGIFVDILSINNIIQISSQHFADDINPNTNYTADGLLTNNTEMVPEAYNTGAKGIWRPKKSYNYFDDRKTTYNNSIPSSRVNLASDGVMNNVSLFNYQYPNQFIDLEPNWKPTNEITKYNDAGFEVENKDVLGIYSSAKYGFNNTLPVVVANNARYDQIYFESFEELANSTTEKHTGKQSKLINTTTTINTDIQTTVGNEYVVSAWVKVPNSSVGYTYNNGVLGIQLAGSSTRLMPVGVVIEGWQKIEGKITVPSPITNLSYTLFPPFNGFVAYFDDIRIFPVGATINTHVYDPVTFKLRATLDDNNYATIYSYDEEGSLFLVKKETEKGIKTIQESRNHLNEQ